jgi:pimeloyl-ACP methyl ester carboxylesterase
MKTVTSEDGTSIAFDQSGEGSPVILVNGALGARSHPMQMELAALLAEDFTVYNYDRRGRGDSGDTAPYAVEREIEDIDALIDEAGGSAFVYGISSGAILALEAASTLSTKVEKLALYEPPFILDDSRPPLPEDYVEQLDEAIAADDRSAAVEIFMTQAMCVPDEHLEPMRNDPTWAEMEELAHTIAYDGAIVRDVMAGEPWPADKWDSVISPTLAISGEMSEEFFHDAAKTLVHDLADAQHHPLEGQGHEVAPEVLVPVLEEFYSA